MTASFIATKGGSFILVHKRDPLILKSSILVGRQARSCASLNARCDLSPDGYSSRHGWEFGVQFLCYLPQIKTYRLIPTHLNRCKFAFVCLY